MEQNVVLRYLFLIRHKNPTMCPVGTLAFYFFYRYQVREDVWPSFADRRKWYDIFLFPSGVNSVKKDSYTSAYKAINKIYEDLGITTSVQTQLGRQGGAAHAENAGASQASVDKQGHWATNSRNGAYANNVVPWDAVRVLAGYQVSPHSHFCPREQLEPPIELQRLIFPQLEQSITDMETKNRNLAGISF